MKYQIEYLNPKDISPAEYNPRGISEEARTGLSQSMDEFGLVGPLIINKRTNRLVSGHQRLKIALEKNYTEVPVIYVDLDDDKEQLLNITLNNQKITGFFTEELNDILNNIKQSIDENIYNSIQLPGIENHIIMNEWQSDITRINNVKEEIEQSKKRIFIDCPTDLYDEVMIYIKAKLMETSFEGIHVR